MNALTIPLIAIGLAMDAMAVSIASGTAMKGVRIRDALRMAGFFGGFQIGMPVIGYSAGVALSYVISGVDHWIAFFLLSFIGCRMIYESTKAGVKPINPLGLQALVMLSIATSIDALGTGVTFVFADIPLIEAVMVIGAVTFALSFGGLYLGDRMGRMFENVVEVIGGLVLIGIGLKILIEHLC